MNRVIPILLISLTIAGCELVGDVFQAGLVVGVIAVLLIVAVIGWILKAMRGRK